MLDYEAQIADLQKGVTDLERRLGDREYLLSVLCNCEQNRPTEPGSGATWFCPAHGNCSCQVI